MKNMKFEKALKLMRKGKKIRCSAMPEDEYFMGCYVRLLGTTFEEAKKNGMSIVKMKGGEEDDTMLGSVGYVARIKNKLKGIIDEKDYKKYHNLETELDMMRMFDNDIFRYPHINLLIIMRDDWEIIE